MKHFPHFDQEKHFKTNLRDELCFIITIDDEQVWSVEL